MVCRGRGLTTRPLRGGMDVDVLAAPEEQRGRALAVGLHMADVQLLVEVLHRLVDDGNTVVVIEHNLDIIGEADYLIDIGPEAGEFGGEIVATGSPEEVAKSKVSRTAPFLRKLLRKKG